MTRVAGLRALRFTEGQVGWVDIGGGASGHRPRSRRARAGGGGGRVDARMTRMDQ